MWRAYLCNKQQINKFTNTQIEFWSFCNVYLCTRQIKQFSDKTNTHETVEEVKNIRRDGKQSFVNLCICVRRDKFLQQGGSKSHKKGGIWWTHRHTEGNGSSIETVRLRIRLFGRCSEITERQYQFFEMDQHRLGGVMNHLNQAGIGEHIYCVLCGRMTPDQKQIVRKRSRIDTQMYIDIMTWFV